SPIGGGKCLYQPFVHRRDCWTSSFWRIQNERQRYQGRWRRLSPELSRPARGNRKYDSPRLRAGTDAGVSGRISLAQTALTFRYSPAYQSRRSESGGNQRASYGRPLLSNFTTVTTM